MLFFLTSVQNTPFRKSLQKTGQDECAVFVPWVHTVHRLTKPKLDPVIGFLHPLRINIPRWISSWVKPSHVPRRTYSSKSEGNSTESASGWHRYVVWWFLFRKLRKRTRLEATGRGLQVLLVNSPSKNDIVVNSMFIKSIVETVKIESLTGLKHISFKGSWISLLETVKVWNWYQMGWKKPYDFRWVFLMASLRQASPRNLMEQIAFDIEEFPGGFTRVLAVVVGLSTCSVLRWFLILCHGKVTIKPALKGDGCFRKWWYPQIIHFNRVFHYKPSILGYPYFWKHPDVFFVGSFFQASSTVANHSCWCSQETKILGGGNSNIFF